jgi:hypothetical protein
MVIAATLVLAFFAWFGVLCETAPTLDYMADDR